MKKIIIISVVLLVAGICGFTVCFADPVLPYGEYELFSVNYAGTEMDPGSMGMSSVLILNENGTGVMTMNGADTELPQWTEGEGVITIYNPNGDPLECQLKDGILTLEMGENYYWYYVHESVNPNAGKDVSMLSRVYNSIDAEKGAHLSYEYHSDYMDSTSIFDVHTKGGSYYSGRITKVAGHEELSASCYLGDTVYLLYPNEKRGSVVMSVSLSLLNNNALMMDDCYKVMHERMLRKDFTVEEREVDGEKFTVEVFPKTALSSEAAFYFDGEGRLVHILVGAPVAMPSLGETFYTIHGFDEAVDESLFSISGYTIE